MGRCICGPSDLDVCDSRPPACECPECWRSYRREKYGTRADLDDLGRRMDRVLENFA